MVVIWGGANDVSKNKMKVGIKLVCNFVENRR